MQFVALENKHWFEQWCTTHAMQYSTCKTQCDALIASYLQIEWYITFKKPLEREILTLNKYYQCHMTLKREVYGMGRG